MGTRTCLLLEVSRGEAWPCRAVSHSENFGLTFLVSLVWHLLGRKCTTYRDGAVLGYL